MLKQIARLRVWLVVVLGILWACSSVLANGSDYGGHDRKDNRNDNRNDNRGNNNYGNGERHYYREGRWYKRDERGNEVGVADIVEGAIAMMLPPQHTTVVIQDTPYYYDNSHYYKQLPDGSYVVVRPPR